MLSFPQCDGQTSLRCGWTKLSIFPFKIAFMSCYVVQSCFLVTSKLSWNVSAWWRMIIKHWFNQSNFSQIDLSPSTHWGRVTHICVSDLTSIDSDNGLSPGRRQAIIWTNAGIMLIWNLGTNFNELLSEIHTFSFKKMHFKMSSAQWRLFRLGLNVLKLISLNDPPLCHS